MRSNAKKVNLLAHLIGFVLHEKGQTFDDRVTTERSNNYVCYEFSTFLAIAAPAGSDFRIITELVKH